MSNVFEGNGVHRFRESLVDRNVRERNGKQRFQRRVAAASVRRYTTYEQPSPTKQAAREVMIARCNYPTWLAFCTLRVTMTRSLFAHRRDVTTTALRPSWIFTADRRHRFPPCRSIDTFYSRSTGKFVSRVSSTFYAIRTILLLILLGWKGRGVWWTIMR